MMEGALAAVFAFLAAIFFARRAKRNIHLVQRYEQCMNAFIDDARTLINADETPEGVVEVIEFISDKATNRAAAREFLALLFRHRRELSSGPTGPTSQMIDAFKAKNPELGHVFSRAMSSGLMAMTYNGGPAGTFVRRLVLFDARHQEDRSRDLAASFREVECAQVA